MDPCRMLRLSTRRQTPGTNRPEQGIASPIRVLFFDHTATLGGGEIALLNLVRHLEPVVVLATDGPLAKRLFPDVETHILPLSPRVANIKKDSLGFSTIVRFRDLLTIFAYIRRLCRFICDCQVDLVHTNSLKADVIGGLAGIISRRPVVWHVRDRIEDDYLPPIAVRVFRLLCRLIPTYIIANSAATLRTLRLPSLSHSSAIPSGIVVNRKDTVVHDGTELAEFVPKGTSTVLRIGLIGRISPWKGQHIFLEAAARVHRHFPFARFVIIGAALFGESEYDQKIRELPARLGIEKVVEFAGFRPDVQDAIADLNLVVHASTTGEPFGQVIIEGMAAAKPIVATNGGGVTEIVEDGLTGMLVPMGDAQAMADAICEILADPEKAKKMGIRGRHRVENHFTVELTASKVEAVYHEILRRRRRAMVRMY
jgi:glycosyltransferase involved in cell wall biosynthesis